MMLHNHNMLIDSKSQTAIIIFFFTAEISYKLNNTTHAHKKSSPLIKWKLQRMKLKTYMQQISLSVICYLCEWQFSVVTHNLQDSEVVLKVDARTQITG